jgi:beta-lactamase superfamily II metal-dependent hydrolase
LDYPWQERYPDGMSLPPITLECLGAGYGDCLLITCPVRRGTWRLLVDTGPDEAWPALRARLAALPTNRAGKRHIDLAIITHIDHDHIGAAQLLFSDRELNLSFGDVWFNARTHLGVRGVAEGQGLGELLGDTARGLPWNRAFDGLPVVTPGKGRFREVTLGEGLPAITLLSPSPDCLTALARTWDKEMERLRRKDRDAAAVTALPRGVGFPNLEALAARISPTDKAPANGSSIAILLEHRGASVLLSADAFPTVLAPALKALSRSRGADSPLVFDAIKVSHHGSRGNVTRELLQEAIARHYILSTNNAVFGLPDDEALARIVLHGGGQPSLWFNYATERNRRWENAALKRKYGFDTLLPPDGQCGITLELGGGGRARSVLGEASGR